MRAAKRTAILAGAAFGLLVALVCVRLATAAPAAPLELATRAALSAGPGSELALFLLLNGEPSKAGTITSTGTSVTNATTATPFTIAAGRVYMTECDGQACIGPGATAHCTFTHANYKPKIDTAPTGRWWWVASESTTISMISVSGTVNCAVFQMK